MKNRKLVLAALLVLGTISTNCLTAFAGQNCPYCDTECVVPLDNPSACGRTLLYSGFAGEAFDGGRLASHAELLYKDAKLHDKSFDGQNVYTLRNDRIRLIYDSATDSYIIGYEYICDDIEYPIDFSSGVYNRFDGKTYNFEPSLFPLDIVSKTSSTNDKTYKDVALGDIRFVDWMCVNNSELPQVVIDKLTRVAELDNATWNEDYSIMSANQNTVEYNNERYENLEVAVEMVCGYIPIDGVQSHQANSATTQEIGPGANL